MLTRKQLDLLRFIQQRMRESGVPPSFDEMKDALDLKSKSGIHRLIPALEERGFLRRLPNRARAIEVIRIPENVRRDMEFVFVENMDQVIAAAILFETDREIFRNGRLETDRRETDRPTYPATQIPASGPIISDL